MEELKPCPFCGSLKIDHTTDCGMAYCESCGVMTTIEEWNTRTESKELETLKESYCRIVEECIHQKEQREEKEKIINSMSIDLQNGRDFIMQAETITAEECLYAFGFSITGHKA